MEIVSTHIFFCWKFAAAYRKIITLFPTHQEQYLLSKRTNCRNHSEGFVLNFLPVKQKMARVRCVFWLLLRYQCQWKAKQMVD